MAPEHYPTIKAAWSLLPIHFTEITNMQRDNPMWPTLRRHLQRWISFIMWGILNKLQKTRMQVGLLQEMNRSKEMNCSNPIWSSQQDDLIHSSLKNGANSCGQKHLSWIFWHLCRTHYDLKLAMVTVYTKVWTLYRHPAGTCMMNSDLYIELIGEHLLP